MQNTEASELTTRKGPLCLEDILAMLAEHGAIPDPLENVGVTVNIGPLDGDISEPCVLAVLLAACAARHVRALAPNKC